MAVGQTASRWKPILKADLKGLRGGPPTAAIRRPEADHPVALRCRCRAICPLWPGHIAQHVRLEKDLDSTPVGGVRRRAIRTTPVAAADGNRTGAMDLGQCGPMWAGAPALQGVAGDARVQTPRPPFSKRWAEGPSLSKPLPAGVARLYKSGYGLLCQTRATCASYCLIPMMGTDDGLEDGPVGAPTVRPRPIWYSTTGFDVGQTVREGPRCAV